MTDLSMKIDDNSMSLYEYLISAFMNYDHCSPFTNNNNNQQNNLNNMNSSQDKMLQSNR